MLKILQASLQQYTNHERPDVQAGFRKGRGTKDQIANICWIVKKAKVPEKHLFLLYWLCQSLWLCGSEKTVENSERVGNTRHLACLLRNLYVGQEAIVRTGHGTTDCFQMRKGVCQGCILSSCLFNLYAETSWETLGWRKHRLESRLPGEMSITSEMVLNIINFMPMYYFCLCLHHSFYYVSWIFLYYVLVLNPWYFSNL